MRGVGVAADGPSRAPPAVDQGGDVAPNAFDGSDRIRNHDRANCMALESGLGGITGDILLADLADLLGPIIGTPRKIGWVAGGLGAVALVTAMGLSAAEWRSIGRGFWWCGAGCIDGLRTLARLFGRTIATVRRERSPQEITRREPVLAEAERAGPRV